MPIFKTETVDEKRLEYINYLKKVANTYDLVLKYAEGSENYNKLNMLADDIRYLLPIEKEQIKEIDKKIFNIIGDLKVLTYTNRDPFRIELKVEQLDKLIDERNTKI